MFLTNSRRGYLGGDQYSSGMFLMVFDNELAPKIHIAGDEKPYAPLRVLVRKVAMRQCGHFMMGHTTILGERFSLSGTYGHDGLPLNTTIRGPAFEPVFTDTQLTEMLCGENGQAQWKKYWDAKSGIPRLTVPIVAGLWKRLHPMPPELVQKFWKGGGHNSSGSEGPSLHEWALANINTFRHLLPKEE